MRVTPVLKYDIHDLMENNLEVVSSFMKLFWEEQKIYLSINPKAGKYHPVVMPTFWEAVAVLELTCKLQVIATVSDGASPK